MALATWKRMAPPDYSGILDAYAKFGEQLGEGITGIGGAATDYADKRSSRETDDFVADLMQAGSQEERDAMINAANTAWLNIDEINATNYELGQPERDLAVALAAEDRAQETWEDRLKATQESNIDQHIKELAQTLLYEQEKYDTITRPEEEAKAKEKAIQKQIENAKNYKPVKDPLQRKGYFEQIFGWNEGAGPFGPGFDEPDLFEIVKYRTAFVNTYNSKEYKVNNANITADDFNRFILSGAINFDDRWGFMGMRGDRFTFAYKNNMEMNIQGNEAELYEAIMNWKNKTGLDEKREAWDFNEFKINHTDIFPEGFDPTESQSDNDLAFRIFEKISAQIEGGDKKYFKDGIISLSKLDLKNFITEVSNITDLDEEELLENLGDASIAPTVTGNVIDDDLTAAVTRYLGDFNKTEAEDLKRQLLALQEDGQLVLNFQIEALRQLLEDASK